MEYTTSSAQETQLIGKNLASQLTGGDIVLLHGELGAGKTTFVKGIAEGLGITDDILSPTFTLMNIYTATRQHSNTTTLVHIDTYRLKSEQELIDIGVEDYLGDENTICVIEWPEKIEKLLIDIRQRRTRLGREKALNVWLTHEGEGRKIRIGRLED